MQQVYATRTRPAVPNLALVIVGALVFTGCRPAVDPGLTGAPTPAAPEVTVVEPSAGAAIATIREVVSSPVWVTLGEAPPQPAQTNQALAYGDRIRTADRALAEVGLATGPVFRIGGNASLTLGPNQLQLQTGQMITWVKGAAGVSTQQPMEPIEILTPVGIAGIRGTTVFVNIAEDPDAPVEIFAWEGQVSFRPNDMAGEVILNSGEQLFVSPLAPPSDRSLEALQRQVQPLSQRVALQRLQNSPLINGFSQPLPTRPALEATVEGLD
jgi:hypothetical protein